jgi:hypothetical protein
MSDDQKMTKAEVLHNMDKGWAAFDAYLKTLSAEQMTVPKDAAGWTVKDHLTHIAVWASGITTLLRRSGSRQEAMGLDDETWNSRDFDRMNATIQQQHAAQPLAEVLAHLAQAHSGLREAVAALADDELYKPYTYFQADPNRTDDTPILEWIRGDSYAHYTEHRAWIEAIVTQAG